MIAADPVTIALAITATGLVVIAIALARRATALDERLNAQARALARVESDLRALLTCSRRIGDRIGDTERAERTLQKQIDKLRFHGDDSQVAVEHAMKLINGGLDLGEVTRICDLTAGEVEILQSLSRFKSAA